MQFVKLINSLISMNQAQTSYKKTIEVGSLIYQIDNEEKKASILDYIDNDGLLIIPRSIIYESQEYPIKAINKKSLFCSEYKNIQFSDDSEVYIFGQKSFYLSEVTSIKLPLKLNKICKSALSNCTLLKRLIIPPNINLKIIEKGAFSESSKIQEILLPPSITDLQDGWCKQISFPTKVTNTIQITKTILFLVKQISIVISLMFFFLLVVISK